MLTRRVATAALRRTTPAAAPAGRRNYVDNVKEIQDYGAEIQREDAAEPIVQNYPVLPEVSRQRLSPFGWTDMLERRNHGDVVSWACRNSVDDSSRQLPRCTRSMSYYPCGDLMFP